MASVERIVLDGSFVNEKRRGILDMRETLTPLTLLLSRQELQARYGERKTSIIVF